MYCTNHAGRQTLLRCGKCEQPFCHDCLVQTPVGLRCRTCANIRPLPQYDVSPARLGLAALAGLVAAVVAGVVFFAVVGVFALWLSPFYGMAVGEAVSRAAGYKSGPRLQVVAGICIVLGAVVGKYGALLLTLAAGGALCGALGMLAQVGGARLLADIHRAARHRRRASAALAASGGGLGPWITRFLPPPRETYQVAYDVACRQARGLDPAQAAARAGVDFIALPEGGACLVPFFGRQYRVTFPESGDRGGRPPPRSRR